MQERKLSVFIATFSYGGNGGIASQHPNVGAWLTSTIIEGRDNPRISNVAHLDYCDTPIPMLRNRAWADAKRLNADVLVMVDSDQAPDLYVGKVVGTKPFFQSSFDYLYDHYDRGPVMIGAPYCGPPPHPVYGGGELCYVFEWQTMESDTETDVLKLAMIGREDSVRRAGIQEVAALPTGLLMADVRLADMLGDGPIFYYEYTGEGDPCPTCGCRKPGKQTEKASTEDVTATRDISLIGMEVLGYNPVLCNWDAWAGHWKPKCVGKPQMISVDDVGSKYVRAIKRNHHRREALRILREAKRA